jgi:hypothetical protein
MNEEKNEEVLVNDEVASEILEILYANAPENVRIDGDKIVDVPANGAMEIIVSGYRGIIATRKKREKEYNTRFYSPALVAVRSYVDKNRKESNENQHSKKA